MARESGDAVAAALEGTCDACEPDEAARAAMHCRDCDFSFCPSHAEEHGLKYGAHQLRALVPVPSPSPPAGDKVETKRCREHGQELSLYCKEHEQIICVLCAMTGAHRQHELVTLQEAYRAASNKEPADLRAAMLEMVARLKDKCTDSNVMRSEMKNCIVEEFDRMHHLAREEERRALHLLDLQEAVATANMSEALADVKVKMGRLMEEMAEIAKQLNTFSELALLKPESREQDPRNPTAPVHPLPLPGTRKWNDRSPPDPPFPGNNHRCFDSPSANGPW